MKIILLGCVHHADWHSSLGSGRPWTLKLHDPDVEGTIGHKNVDKYLPIYMA
jgi:hypothetical protein